MTLDEQIAAALRTLEAQPIFCLFCDAEMAEPAYCCPACQAEIDGPRPLFINSKIAMTA